MANGTIGIVTITGGGSGYTTTPTITFTGLSTVSAAATAIVSTAGTISAIHITNAGAGYTTPPTIAIAPPAVETIAVAAADTVDNPVNVIVGVVVYPEPPPVIVTIPIVPFAMPAVAAAPTPFPPNICISGPVVYPAPGLTRLILCTTLAF
jgi:hypothetical protein